MNCPYRSATTMSILCSLLLPSNLLAAAEAAPSQGPMRAVAIDAIDSQLKSASVFRITSEKPRKLTVNHFSISQGEQVSLSLERFSPTGSGTQFVLGGREGDVHVPFDAGQITMYRGNIQGEKSTSHVYMAFSENHAVGWIQRSAAEYQLVTTPTAEGCTYRVIPARQALFPDVPFCGVQDSEVAEHLRSAKTTLGHSQRRLKQLELAIDSDYEYYSLFGDFDAAATYLVMLYGAVSDIYIRDLGVYITLTYVRLHDAPNDEPGYMNMSDPLGGMGTHWQATLTHVDRDVAQFVSARRDFSYGGVAHLNSLCDVESGYSVAGYIRGFYPDPNGTSIDHWDLIVTAHELGHSCSALHTHDYGIDACPSGEARRGTIMSYCHTNPGGAANVDIRFHSFVQQRILQASVWNTGICIIDDCNENGLDDSADIGLGSEDDNENGVPDECEDCDADGIRDDIEIQNGSADVNHNGIPDECEPDCNDNGWPDDVDLYLLEPHCNDQDGYATTQCPDENGNRVLDECERDCNSDGLADYNQIQSNMELDTNRNLVLDECEDCWDGFAAGGNGQWDWLDLGHPGGMLVIDRSNQVLHLLHSIGTLYETFSGFPGPLQDVAVSANGRVFVLGWSTSGGNEQGWLVELDPSNGTFLNEQPIIRGTGLALSPQNHVLISNGDDILEYAFGPEGSLTLLGVFASYPGHGDYHSLLFGENGLLYASKDLSLDILTADDGILIRRVEAVRIGRTGYSGLHELAIAPDGRLLVACHDQNTILVFDIETGTFDGEFVAPPPQLLQPYGITTKDEAVYVAGLNSSGASVIYRYDGYSGIWLNSPWRNDNRIGLPGAMTLLPSSPHDLNSNDVPDVCDQCVTDQDCDDGDPCNGAEVCTIDTCTRSVDPDCNSNGIVDICEIQDGDTNDCNQNQIPDICESQDCNDNGIIDTCDIARRNSPDIDLDEIPDECRPHLYVPSDYPTIQSAVDSATTGNFVVLEEGTYTGEGNRDIEIRGKSLVLTSISGAEKTIIDLQSAGRGFSIVPEDRESSNVQIHGLTIKNGNNASGGGIYCNSDTRIVNCIFQGNTSQRGGAIYLTGAHGTIENCVVSDNVASQSGGGMYVAGGAVTLQGCTIVSNHANIGGGVFYSGGNHNLTGNIVWGNEATEGSQLALTLWMTRSGAFPITLSTRYSNIEMGDSGLYMGSESGITVNWGDHNMDLDPRFVMQPPSGSFAMPDYHLRADSPCINAGDPQYEDHPSDLDIDGDPRLQGLRVDIGADEFLVDCNENGRPDAQEIVQGTSEDCNENSIPDMCDIAAIHHRRPLSSDCNDNGVPDECELNPCLMCDINGDGTVDALDEELLNHCLMEYDPDLCHDADLNGDGKITPQELEAQQQCFKAQGNESLLPKSIKNNNLAKYSG